MKAVVTTRAALPWSRDLAWVKKELTLVSKPLSPLAVATTLPMYEIVSDKIYVPKAWALYNAANLGITAWKDKQHHAQELLPEDMELNLPLGLRPHQTLATDAILKVFRDEPLGGGCLLNFPCGGGKSVCALVVAHRMGLKTLIVVNTAILATQWKNVIAEYIPGARVGMIQQARFEVEDRTHVVAVAHTVAGGRHDFTDAGFGLIVVDETHRICCPTLSKCMAIAGCRYRLGLTATPVRPDGFDAFLHAAIGPIAFKMTRDNPEDLRVYSVQLDEGPSRMHLIRAKGKDTPCIARILNDMQPESGARAVERQEVASRWIKLCVDKRRQVLVVADRIEMLEDLAVRVMDGTEITTAFLIGKTKARDRETAHEANVILASFACASEGLDVPSLDTIVLLTPRSGSNVIVQCVGRLLRNGGRSPLVIDLVDKLAPFQGMYRKRLTEYNKMGAVVTRWSEQFEKMEDKPQAKQRSVKDMFEAQSTFDFVSDNE